MMSFLTSDGAAAWVQAIGALLALAIAIWVPAARAKMDSKEKRLSMLAVAEAAHSHASNIRLAIDSSNFEQGEVSLKMWNIYDPSIIIGVVRGLQNIPLHELGSRKGVISLLSITDQMVLLGKAVDAFIDGPHRNVEHTKLLQSIPEDDHKMRRQLHLQVFSILANNARLHLDRIDKDYLALVESVRV